MTVVAFLICVVIIYLLPFRTAERPESFSYLYQMAYNRTRNFYINQDCITVYIKEDGIWEPFLVLEANYAGRRNNGTLLLRRYLLPNRVPWYWREFNQERGADPHYYPTSYIDYWLNTEYMARFSYLMQETILVANVVVEAHEPPNQNRATKIVQKQIFLLSEQELGGVSVSSPSPVNEGRMIRYFYPGRWFYLDNRLESQRRQRLQAVTRYGYAHDSHVPMWAYGERVFGERGRGFSGYMWWTRTERRTIAGGTIATVGERGILNPLEPDSSAFVRPAFTMPANTLLTLYEIKCGKFVYVINLYEN